MANIMGNNQNGSFDAPRPPEHSQPAHHRLVHQFPARAAEEDRDANGVTVYGGRSYCVEIDRSAEIVRISFSGTVTEDSVRELSETLPTLPGYDARFRHLADLTQISVLELTYQYVASLAHTAPPRNHGFLVIVAPRDLLFGVGRMFQQMAEPVNPKVEVVRSMAEAYEVLNQRAPER